jgi:hypothetical protein
VTLADQLAARRTVEEVVGRLAWSSGLIDQPEPCRPVDLVADFDPSRIRRDPWTWSGGA